MPTKTWYINQINGDLYYNEDGDAVANATSISGWTVGKIAAGNYSNLVQGVESGTGTFSTTIVPNNTAPTVNSSTVSVPPYTPPDLLLSNNSVVTLYPYNGYFPAGTWTFNFPVIAVTAGGVQDGRMGIRVFKARRSGNTFASTTELTAARLVGTTVTNLTTTTAQTSTVSWTTAPIIQLNNEFLIIKVAWEIVGAGNANNQDVLMRYGVAATMVSTVFRKRSYRINNL